MTDRGTVGGALAVIAALLVGCAAGIAIDRDRWCLTVTNVTAAPFKFGDLMKLRSAESAHDHCFFLAPKWLGGGLRQVPSAVCQDWKSTGYIVDDLRGKQ